MNTIKNIHLLADILPSEEVTKLEEAAHLYQRHANITFKVLKVQDNELIVEIRQGRNFSGNYLNRSELSERAKGLFEKQFPGYVVHSRPVPYVIPAADQVTPDWIKKRMNDNKVSIKRIVQDTGLDKTNVSAWINGTRPMSQVVKALFFHYFDGWIKTSDRLPLEGELVLVGTVTSVSMAIHLGNGEFKIVTSIGDVLGKVFQEEYWMPLPSTPAINELAS